MTAAVLGVAYGAAIGLGALLAAYGLLELWDAHNRRHHAPTGAEDAGLTGWHKPPAASGMADPRRTLPGQTPGAGTIPVHPAPGHHRGDHMVIDVWEDGCIYTWTRKTGWVHDTRCLDEELRRLLTP